MRERNIKITLAIGVLSVCGLGVTMVESTATGGPVAREPGGTAMSELQARRDPHALAWDIFCYLNRQAKAGVAGAPDPRYPDLRTYEDDQDVIWETFARITPDQKGNSEVFPKTYSPTPWESLPRPEVCPVLSKAETACFGSQREHIFPNPKGPFDFVPGSAQEVRINRPAYEYISDHGLYCQGTLSEIFKSVTPSTGADCIDFPESAKLIKAVWEPLYQRDKSRYHWRTVPTRGEPDIYRLVALHVVTKDSMHWFWSTFIHVDYESIKSGEKLGGPPAETYGTKWENYRLLGTQTEFTDSLGVYTQLWNRKIEPQASSCISCHACASVDSTGAGVSPPPREAPPFGAPDPRSFWTMEPSTSGTPDRPKKLMALPTDFIWGLGNARPGNCKSIQLER